MKKTLAPVKNVISAHETFENLCRRAYGVPGIGLIHGPTGLGKTTTITHMFNKVNGVYVVARATDTATSLLGRIMNELGADPMSRVARMEDHIIEQMSMHERPLFIDEADYLMNDVRMLDTVRDIYMATEVPVVLIGMDQIARRISSRKQFFNRISEWAEFKPADLEDTITMADTLLDDGISVDVDLLQALLKATGGNMRHLTVGLGRIERLAKAGDLELVTEEHWGDHPFFGGGMRA